jgi:hypothetical protein
VKVAATTLITAALMIGLLAYASRLESQRQYSRGYAIGYNDCRDELPDPFFRGPPR